MLRREQLAEVMASVRSPGSNAAGCATMLWLATGVVGLAHGRAHARSAGPSSMKSRR